MSFLFIYILKLAVSLAVVFLFYHVVLRKLTFYNWNRWYLLGYSLLSFFIPFIDISTVLQRNEWSETSIVKWVPVIHNSVADINSNSVTYSFTMWNLISLLIIAGMLIMLIRLLVQFISFRRMMKKAHPIATGFISGENIKLYQVDDDIIPFSFGNSIFINLKLHTETELQEVIRHEFVHVKQKHSADIIWAEILCLLNWYNPFAWLLKAAIRQNLEFVADNKVLENGINKKQYQYLLLKVIGSNQFSIAQKFNFSSLKKRIAMMNKIKSARVHVVRFLFVLPLLAALLLSFRKQIGGDSLTRKESNIKPPAFIIGTDSIPEVTETNSKGYIINVKDNKGNCILVIKDKVGKEVKKILLTEWKANVEKYEALYGEIPPPPPPPPAVATAPEAAISPTPPVPPVPATLPDNVKKINVNNNKATIWLKNGQKETYDLNNPDEKVKLEKKYGEILPPPPPPPKAVSAAYNDLLNTASSEYEITDKKAVIKLKNGTVEKYDLTNKEERAAFEKKYGKIVDVNMNVNTDVHTNVNADVRTNVNSAITTDLKSVTAPVALKASVGVAVSPKVSVKSNLTTVITPAAITTNVTGTSAIATSPRPASLVSVIDDYGYVITGKEDIIITITKNTTRQELDKFITQMKEKGIDLDFDEIEYNEKGILVSINGTMKSGESNSNFVATDFDKLILAMIRKGERTYFKVSVKENKVVI